MSEPPSRPRAGRIGFFPLGDRALVMELGGRVGESSAALARRIADAVGAARLAGVHEAVSAYASVTVYYDPVAVKGNAGAEETGLVPYALLQERLQAVLDSLGESEAAAGVLLEVPVC